MTSSEGHDCWEDCDEGPHGCLCGNDCTPPNRAGWWNDYNYTPHPFIQSPSKVFLGDRAALEEGWDTLGSSRFEHLLSPMKTEHTTTLKFVTDGIPKDTMAQLLGIPVAEMKVPLEPRPEYDGGWKAWAEKHLVDYVHPHDLYRPDDSKAQRHAVVMKDEHGRKTIMMPNALVEMLRGNVQKISTERSWVIWTPRLVWKALLWVPRHPRPFIHTFKKVKNHG